MANAVVTQTAAQLTAKTLATLQDANEFTADNIFDGKVTINDDFRVDGATLLNGDIEVNGGADINGDTNIDGNVTIAGSLTAESTGIGPGSSITGSVAVSGAGAIVPSVSGSQIGWERRTKTILTDAQIKALPITPITLVPAPGVDKYNKFKSALVLCNFTAAHYTNVDAASSLAILFSGGNPASDYVVNDATTDEALADMDILFKDNNTPKIDLVPFTWAATPMNLEWGNAASAEPTTETNQALQLNVDNGGSGAFTGGNVANSMIVYVYYDVVDVP